MSARDDNPRLHRIEVDRDSEGEPTFVRFVCDGGDDAPCHRYPDCDCEAWGDEHGDPRKGVPPQPGHEDVQQRGCWIDPWFNDAVGHEPLDWIEAWDGFAASATTTDRHSFRLSLDDLHSGPVSVTFEGDYMTWDYAGDDQ